jgi:hypothetical protein
MPAAPRCVAGIYASGANIAMTPGIVPPHRGDARSRAARETALADSRDSAWLHGPPGPADPHPDPDLEDGVPVPIPEPVVERDAWRTALEIARRDVSKALDRLIAAGQGSAGTPDLVWTDHALDKLLERLADELGFLISRLTSAGVPSADFVPLSRLLADLRRALDPATAHVVDQAELHKRACRVLRQFVDSRSGRQQPVSTAHRPSSGRSSAFWRPTAG